MPRTAAKIEDFRAHPARRHPRLRRPYRRHRHRRHGRRPPAASTDEGFAGHAARSRPAASSAEAELDARLAAYADAGVREALVLAGGIARPRGPFAEAMQLLETGLLRRPRLHPPARRRPPGGQPRHRPRRRRDRIAMAALRAQGRLRRARPTPRWRSPPSSASRPQPVIAWADRLRAAGITCRVHIGVAGPAKLQTLIKFAMACGVGPSCACCSAAPRT